MIVRLVIEVNEEQADTLKSLLISADGRHGDPYAAWASLGSAIVQEYGVSLLHQLQGKRLSNLWKD